MLLVKVPKTAPSSVLLSAVVGLPEIFQQTPLATIASTPPLVIVPPPVAVVVVTELIVVVVTIGRLVGVVKDYSSPYAVPALFVA